MSLHALLAGAPAVRVRALTGAPDDVGPAGVAILDVAFDSRYVGEGALFCCLRGGHHDGHEFAEAAVAHGASALLVDHELAISAAVQIVVDDTRNAMAHLAAQFFGRPSEHMSVIGITGTNAKTTTAHILAGALEALGRHTGVIGTLTGAHTTPESAELQRRLAEFASEGCDAVAMEVSSHALALDRVIGTRFRVSIFTNLGHDHLDLHGTQERYFAAKARLFEPDLTEHGVVNVDDVHGRLLVDAATVPMSTYSLADVADVVVGAGRHEYTWRGERVRVGLGGRFNVMNSLAAATALAALGFAPAEIGPALAATTPVPGRFESVNAGQPFSVIVDYAHTPDALIEVLAAARGIAAGHRVSIVFGCGGDRDHDKRARMGNAAVEGADMVIVTSDNPRSEDPLSIIDDVTAGISANYPDRITVEPDRRQAISLALAAAGPGDVVIIAGKGHEKTQTFHSVVEPFDDRAVARDLLEHAS